MSDRGATDRNIQTVSANRVAAGAGDQLYQQERLERIDSPVARLARKLPLSPSATAYKLGSMTQRWAYVGALGPSGSLDWGGSHSGNTPTAGQLRDLDSTAFWKIMRLADEGKSEGRQVDWGAWALKVNGPQLREVLAMIYGEEHLEKPSRPIDTYLALADQLGEYHQVALVAAEL